MKVPHLPVEKLASVVNEVPMMRAWERIFPESAEL
jgi:hypothetical protein